MKKIFLILAAVVTVELAAAQSAQSIVERYEDQVGLAKFNATRDGRSSMLDVKVAIGPMAMTMKVVAKYPNQYRIEMDVAGQKAVMVLIDSVAYVSAGGQPVQRFTDRAQIEAMAPTTDILGFLALASKDSDFRYLKQEKRGKATFDVIESVRKADGVISKLYFNTQTGLCESSESEPMVAGKNLMFAAKYSHYTKFGNGEIMLPTVIQTKVPTGNIVLTIKNFELDYPTAAWMFAEPK